jgi:hypothetical protein
MRARIPAQAGRAWSTSFGAAIAEIAIYQPLSTTKPRPPADPPTEKVLVRAVTPVRAIGRSWTSDTIEKPKLSWLYFCLHDLPRPATVAPPSR